MVNEKVTSKLNRRKINRCANISVKNMSVDALKDHLNVWLESRTCWNHDEWVGLLSDLRDKGYSDLIDTPKGQEVIGRYLEHNKNCPEC
jgi:hypothetical protein